MCIRDSIDCTLDIRCRGRAHRQRLPRSAQNLDREVRFVLRGIVDDSLFERRGVPFQGIDARL